MRWLLVWWRDQVLGDHWRTQFAGAADVDVVEADICEVDCDAVVSPANSFGFMDGGLDYRLSERFGWGLQERLQRLVAARPLGELLVGEALVVPTGDARVPWLISAPTMRVPMRLARSVNAYLATKAALVAALGHREQPPIRTVAIPGLGTGSGGLDPETAARQMAAAYREVVLRNVPYPADFDQAQRRHIELNPAETLLGDRG